MAASFRLSNAAASAAAGDGSNQGLRAFISTSAKVQVRVGAQNTDPESAPAGTLLSTITLGAGFGTASNGVITMSTSSSDTNAAASGTAGSFWFTKSDGSTPIADGNAGIGSSYALNFDNNVIVAGGTVTISSFSITVPPHTG